MPFPARGLRAAPARELQARGPVRLRANAPAACGHPMDGSGRHAAAEAAAAEVPAGRGEAPPDPASFADRRGMAGGGGWAPGPGRPARPANRSDMEG